MLHPVAFAPPTPRIGDQENVGPLCQPAQVTTVAEFAELAEPAGHRYELCQQLLGSGLLAIAGLEVELGSAEPGTVRRPDIVVTDGAAYRRVVAERRFLRAEEVRLAVEIESADSVHTDRVAKRVEYARARIGHYWVVDLDAPVSVLLMRLVDDLGYLEDGEVTGVCTVDGAFVARLRLDELAR